MFTYLDPEVRRRLIDGGSLVRIDSEGRKLDPRLAPPADTLSISLLGPIPLPVDLLPEATTMRWYAAVRHTELTAMDDLAAELRAQGQQNLFSQLASFMTVNSILVTRDMDIAGTPLVRVHSNCLTGDVFGSQRCDCGPQLQAAAAAMLEHPAGGMLVYMAGHEGRGIGLWAKAATYLLQDAGEDTYQANRSLGLPDDCRDFTDAAVLLKHFLRGRRFRLLTNNPKKIDDLTALGVENIEQQNHIAGVTRWNRRYLSAKRDWGHDIDPDLLT